MIGFFRTPKGLLLLILSALLMLAALGEGVELVAPGVIAAVGVAALIDLVILRLRRGGWEFPSGAVLTGLLVAMVLSPREPWYVVAITSALAIVSKYILRTRSANVFNPAALAIVATFYIFHTNQSWWGALPEVTPFALVALFATGVFITDRVNKMPLVLMFLGVYFALFAAAAFLGDPRGVAEIFRTPDLQAVLFFAFFILTDPPTSPVKYRPQLVCGVIVAVASYVVFEWVGAVYYLLAGVLAGNVWEAWERNRRIPLKRHAGHRALATVAVVALVMCASTTAAPAQEVAPPGSRQTARGVVPGNDARAQRFVAERRRSVDAGSAPR